MTEEYAIIGKRLPRVEAPLQVSGAAKYTADFAFPGMLCGKILTSPHPHAKILSIDVSKALRLPGVKAIITGKDTIGRPFGFVPGSVKDELALAIDRVRYIGDAVAAVAAVDEDTAEEALELIKVTYQPLPAVFDPVEAMQPGAPLLHEHRPRNITHQVVFDYGDVEQAFKEAAYVREDRFTTQKMHAGFMEPHAAVAVSEATGKLTLYSTSQAPFFLRRTLSNTLGIPESSIRIIKPFLGGGFGGKCDMFPKDFCSSLLAMKTGRPVKIAYTLEEALGARQRHASITRLKTGVKKDGTILAVEGEIIADGGAYISTGPVAISVACAHTTFPFRVPNKKVIGYRVYTNKVPCGPVRGHGAPQGHFPMALQLAYIAEDMGLDPVDMMLRNCLRLGDSLEPFEFYKQLYGERVAETMKTQKRLTSCGLPEAIEKAAEAVSWKKRKGKLPLYRGIGIGLGGFPSGGMGGPGGVYRSGAIVQVHPDGEVTLLIGATDLGQGLDSLMRMICAEELGVALEDIRLLAADTELTPLDPGSWGSQATTGAGNAVKIAAADAKHQLLEDASHLLEAPPEKIEAKNRSFFVKGQPERKVSLADVLRARRYANKSMPVVGHGTDDASAGPGYSFCAQVAEVEVDPETGKIKVLHLVSADDVGTPLSPLAVEGQIQGSTSNGLGYTLYEELFFDQGQMLNANDLDFRLPTVLEMPEKLTLIPIITRDPKRPFGAKESGEGTTMATVGAIATAVYNALGVKINSLPLTPDKVLKALANKAKEKKGKP